MTFETIDYQKRGAVAYVTLNRPTKLNAMNAELHEDLARAWADFRDDPELRVAILSGHGRCFSAGADLSGGVPEERFVYTGDYPDITQTQQIYKPIIAALHGHVIGYGMWIAMDADIRIATPDVSFWLPEPQWGIATIPAGWFPKMMPWAIASELLLQAGRVSAERAHQVGIVNSIVAADDLMAEAEKVAHRICSLSPVAVQGMKEMMVRSAALDYEAIDRITESVQNRVMNSADRKEGSRAFVQGGEVDWPGR
jgi:enoyl-CoA hydratase/carnithine racemase